ncbi:helix-turn-helix domain-containing protein [Nocardia sp. NPDC050175]|uniref:helix-turn-helix domain-containing protein n=1 Tax=Nocardia sp. NPDC050175 TaxID=3364317 RepID=UPI0037A3ED97
MPVRPDEPGTGHPRTLPAPGPTPTDGPPARAEIEVPLHHPHRQDLLRREWRQQMGHLPHVRNLTLPHTNAHGLYRSRVQRRLVDDVGVSDQYTDELAGSSGGHESTVGAQVLVHLIGQGALRVADASRQADIGPGMLCIRDLRTPWDFAFTEPTTCRTLSLPRAALVEHIRTRTLPALTVVPRTAPAARLLLAHVDLARDLTTQLNGAGATAARDAMLMLLAGVITSETPHDEPQLAESLVAAATRYADTHLHDRDLSPAVIARALCVSVRTLHRAFATADESAMAYVRRRRLEKAHIDLTHAGTVAEVAARWHFADTSHFRRAYKAHFGHPPRGHDRVAVSS